MRAGYTHFPHPYQPRSKSLYYEEGQNNEIINADESLVQRCGDVKLFTATHVML